MLVILGNAPAGQNGAQVVRTAQLLARFVKATAQAIAAVVRVDQHIQPVHRIAFLVVEDDFTMANQIVILVRVGKLVVIHLHRERHANQIAVVFNGDLAVGKFLDQLVDSVPGPGTADIVIDSVHQCLELIVIIARQVAQI